jgi:uncharacterized protein (DUF1501 family)
MKQQDDAGKFNRRDFLTLGTAGMTLAVISPLAHAAEKKAPPPETFMMFPGN